ncbi:hypothetical protein A4X09_0g4542 [Tilletia walkeri]|uniref:BRCT domain-containing protein n=1 Tax=Tilletia walkeri TaxID=117179 RepID=A0A8X7N610_9BASI|nr:hypothetical protein A4X09_0g4542 [Tilletia walkeri]
MSKAESPTRRHHLRRLADMSGSTRDAPDPSVTILTRARRRAMESSSEDDHSGDSFDNLTTPQTAYSKIMASRRTPSAQSSSSASPDPIDSLCSSPTKRTMTTDRSSPTKASNPFSNNSALRSRNTTSTSTSPTRPSEAIAARLAAARPTSSRTSAFSTADQPSDHDRGRRTIETTRSTSSRVSRSPTKVATSSELKADAPSRRKSIRSRATATPTSDENDNPFAPSRTSMRDAEAKNDTDHISERTVRLTRRRSVRGLEPTEAFSSEKEDQRTVTPASARISAALARRRRQESTEVVPVKTVEVPLQQTSTPSAEDDAAEQDRKEKERQERLARRRSLYSYLPPKRTEAEADAQEVDALLKAGPENPKTPPKTSTFSFPASEASLSRTSNPFVRSRPKTSSGANTTSNVEENINEVKGSFQRMSLDDEKAHMDISPVRSSRPPVTTPGLNARKDRPHSSSLAAAVATLARGGRVPLRACTILVDVRDMDGEDVSAPWIEKLRDVGARVYSRWPGEKTVLTHVVWKSGRPSTLNTLRALEKEVERKLEEGAGVSVLTPGVLSSTGSGLTRRRSLKDVGGETRTKAEDQTENLNMPLIVGVGWAQACVTERRHVDEEPYLVEIGKEALFNRRRRSSMAPKSAPPSPPTPERPTPSHSRGRKSLASSSLRSEIEKARRQGLQYAPVVSSPLRKRCLLTYT